MSEPTIYNEIALKIKGQQKEVEKLRKELKLAEENEEYWHNAFSDLEDEYVSLKQEIEDYKSRCEKASEITQNLLNTENSGYYKIIFQKQLDILYGKGDE